MGLLSALFGREDTTVLTDAIQKGAFLIDVRSPSEFSAGSVKGAVNIPLNTLSEKFSILKNKKNIIVFCRSGARSRQATSLLELNGFTQVINGGSLANMIKLTDKK